MATTAIPTDATKISVAGKVADSDAASGIVEGVVVGLDMDSGVAVLVGAGG